MAIHVLQNETYTGPIELAAGDIIQNLSGFNILVTPGLAGDDDNALRLPHYGGSLQVDAATTIYARYQGYGEGRLLVITGF